MILLSLASKQIWPQVLAVTHLKPDRVIFLHSIDALESKSPAQRLKRFFNDSGLVPKGNTRLEAISDCDFDAIESSLDELVRAHQLPLAQCVVNFTGGNKLMATAVFRWAARHAQAFYLERRNQLTWFSAPDGRMVTRSEPLNGHITDHLDPVALLRCQLEASEVEREGQSLTLNDAGQNLAEEEFYKKSKSGYPLYDYLKISGSADAESKPGDPLEFNSAAVLLKLGVRKIQRSLRLKVKSTLGVSSRRPHAEIDLLFNWNGRLWLVDCKDRMPAENLVDKLRSTLPGSLSSNTRELLDRIYDELSISQTKALKEDLLAVREIGGLLGQVVCVRKAELPEEVAQFAAHNQIALAPKNELLWSFRNLLFQDRPADPGDLADLAKHFGK